MCVQNIQKKGIYRSRQNNETLVTDTHFFINMVLDHLLPSAKPQFFLEWTSTSLEQSLTEFYTILHEEYFQVALEMLEVEIC
jgi:hypothetical protein